MTYTTQRWDDVENEQLGPKLTRRLIVGERIMLAQLWMEPGFVVPLHSHDNEQMTYIIEGALEFAMGDDEEHVIVHAGEVLFIPGGVPHSAVALERTLDMDIFCPPRADWLDGTDDYLRG
jgi:quercetin dioxygenase-like cupin family protein